VEEESRPLGLGETITFTKVFDAGTFIIFYSSSFNPFPDTKVLIDNTSVGVLSAEDDTLLHISFRRAKNQMCSTAIWLEPPGAKKSACLSKVSSTKRM
jgi:hypothetical protein